MLDRYKHMREPWWLALAICLAPASGLWGQSPIAPADSSRTVRTLLQAFEQGRYQGHFRSFAMWTDNARSLSDYHAWAAGGDLSIQTAAFHGFSMGIGGMFNVNLHSSDLGAKDPATGAANRYEIGLFDVENPDNRGDLDRMESFWLRYERPKWQLTAGRQEIQTPFINPQDGRMRPTVVSGLWGVWKMGEKTRLEGGWLWGISPRSTVRWYKIGTSIGLYPRGLNPDGSASGYAEHLSSEGVGLLGLRQSLGKYVKLQVWDQYVENIFNTAFIQADYSRPLNGKGRLLLGIQAVHQDALAQGGNPDQDKTYFEKGAQSNTLSAQAGWQHKQWQFLTAYTLVTADGRFLTPREWGREPFYTFMSRERIEGSGDVHAVTGRLSWQNIHRTLLLGLAYGHFYLPDIREVRLNKYAFLAYRQVNVEARYAFKGTFKGLQGQFLYVWKGRIGDTYGNDRYVINRVDMGQFNLILNYTYQSR